MPIEMRDFSAGWIPSDDAYNGRKNGMLRMMNLCLDENGIISLTRGNSTASGALAALTHSLYSRYLGSDLYRYAALTNGSVLRDKNKAATFGTSVLTGGSTSRSEFAAALNQVYIVSGTKYVKDDGSHIYPIGLPAPVAPTTSVYATTSISTISAQNLDGSSQYTNWSLDVGTYGGAGYNNANGDIRFEPDSSSFQAVIRTVFSSVLDTTSFSGGGTARDTDIFQFFLSVPDSTQLLSVNIKFLAADPGSSPSLGTSGISYYDYTWNDGWISNVWSHLSALRSDFTFHLGGDQNIWTKIKAIVVTFVCASQINNPNIGFTELEVKGGSAGSLNGKYVYFAQNIYNTGTYQAASAVSPASVPLEILNGVITVVPPTPSDAQTNQINIYRQELGSQANATLLKSVTTPYSAFQDGISDADLLTQSGITANLFLVGIQSLTDSILALVGLYFARMLYFTASKLIISDYLDPDAYDSRYVISYSGNAAEVFLWARKVSNSVVFIGTNYDIYQLTGTLAPLPDGTIDAIIRPLGVAYPPISRAVAVEGNSVIYMANDGWRVESPGYLGDTSTNISSDLRLLFKGFVRYNLNAVAVGYDDVNFHRCTVNKGKFYTASVLSNGDVINFIYDLERKYWYPLTNLNPNVFFTEEDGTLLGGGFADKIVRVIDDPSTNLVSGAAPLISLLTPIFDGGTPRQRKDTSTLKIKCDTGTSPLVLKVLVDGTSHTLSPNLSSNGVSEVIYDGASFTLGKSYQFAIDGASTTFKLFYIQLEYQDRPVQTTSLRIPASTKGTSGKKRTFNCPPIIIDTLGNNITFQPLVDGSLSSVANPTINTSEKITYIPTFSDEVVCTDLGGLLSGGLFEFYGVFEQDWQADVIPIGKLVDQAGPFEVLRYATLERFRYRCICEGTTITYRVYVEDTLALTNSFTSVANVDKTYEVVLPRVGGTTFRIVFTSANLIHRYSCKVKLRITGGAADGKWIG